MANKTRDEVLREVQDVFRNVFRNPALELSLDMVTGDLPGWDSIKNVEILLACEEFWRLQFSSAEIDGIRSIDDLVRTIRGHLS
ncbi:MAG: acyl carrier protein [Zoogloea sp.]|nr:acyl carrier protein [Zoogloea sp.]